VTLENLFSTPFKLTTAEQVQGTLASIVVALANEEYGSSSIKSLGAQTQYGYTASATNTPVGPRFVRITDIRRGVVDWSTVPYCDCAEPAKYLLEADDILVARTGSIGKSFLVDSVPEEAVFASYLIRIRGGASLHQPYLYWVLQSVQFWDHVSRGRGTAQKNVNAKKLEQLAVPVPPPEVQELLAAWMTARATGHPNEQPPLPDAFASLSNVLGPLDTVTEIHDALERRRSSLDAWAPSVLNRLFSVATETP
jgi:hypothetical protein